MHKNGIRTHRLIAINLRMEPDYFNFPVAIGPSVDRYGGIDIADPSRSMKEYCSVTLGEGKRLGPEGPVKRVVEMRSDHRSATLKCGEQLTLALRLYRRGLFWVLPFGTLADWVGRVGECSEYALVGNGVDDFSKFASRLAPLHFERNLYQLLKDEPVAVRMSGEPLR